MAGQLRQNDGGHFRSSMVLDIFKLLAKSTTASTTTTTTMININLVRS